MPDNKYAHGIYIKEIQGQHGLFFNIDMDVELFYLSVEHHIKVGNDGRKRLKLTMSKRREPSDKGLTHYCKVDDYIRPDIDSGNCSSVVRSVKEDSN